MLDYGLEGTALVHWKSSRSYRCHAVLMACRRHLLCIVSVFPEASRVFGPSEGCCMGLAYYVEARTPLDDLVDTGGIVSPYLYRCRMSRVNTAEHNGRVGRPLSIAIVQTCLRL
jgi:hypothetical protein